MSCICTSANPNSKASLGGTKEFCVSPMLMILPAILPGFCHSARKYAVSVRNLCGFDVCLILSLSMKIKRPPWARIKPLFLGDRWLRCFCCPFLWDKSYPILSLTSGGNGTRHEWCDWLTRKLPHQWRSGGDNSQNTKISYNCILPLIKTVEQFVVEILNKLN